MLVRSFRKLRFKCSRVSKILWHNLGTIQDIKIVFNRNIRCLIFINFGVKPQFQVCEFFFLNKNKQKIAFLFKKIFVDSKLGLHLGENLIFMCKKNLNPNCNFWVYYPHNSM